MACTGRKQAKHELFMWSRAHVRNKEAHLCSTRLTRSPISSLARAFLNLLAARGA